MKLKPNEVKCMLGRFNLSNPMEQGSVTSLVSEIVIHEEWNSTSWRYNADIAIIVLMESIAFSKTIQPICLPEKNYDYVNETGIVVGWGKSEHSGLRNYDDTPSKVQIPAINDSYCLTKFPKLAQHADVGTFCGGYEYKGKAPCFGDSGGGFYLKSSVEGTWNVKGIVSGSLGDPVHGCGINYFQLYTNVARFIDWIAKVTNENEWKYVDFDCATNVL